MSRCGWRCSGDDYRRIVKLAVEEFIELMGYYLLLIGTLEYVYQVRAITHSGSAAAATRRRESRKPKSEGRF